MGRFDYNKKLKEEREKLSEFRSSQRKRNLFLICLFLAVICLTSTYAWFIGLQDVAVDSFDVSIAVTDTLLLSLDGENWAQEVIIDEDVYTTQAYAGNTNSWATTGLVPLSSAGKVDDGSSRMVLYRHAAITASPSSSARVSAQAGGYHILASRINNYNGKPEQPGYIAFDLFIKNKNGAYFEEYDPNNEEAIYLSTDSLAYVSYNGGVEGTGIENTVRVGFAQIGRVSAETTDVDMITGISCQGGNGVTPICSRRTAQLWEPNDTAHVPSAISFYNTACRQRTGYDVTLSSSYNGKECASLVNGKYFPTYPISKDIPSGNKTVDIYDGHNGYSGSISSGYLSEYVTFTDSQKIVTGTERPTFFTLAAASITKIRVYVWIEGQDIDNYDYAAAGLKIQVGFGFTKERFTEEDVDYSGPTLPDTVGVCLLPEDFDPYYIGTEAECAVAYGNWHERVAPERSYCTGNTYAYCFYNGGAFTKASDYDQNALGTCTNMKKEIFTQKQCTNVYGTWNEETKSCTGLTYKFCKAMDGVFTPNDLN